jgi:hypothetical protein
MYPDDEIDRLVAELGASLPAEQYRAFEIAAHAAIAGIACPGPGSVYRVLALIQRTYFDPPIEDRMPSGPRVFQRASKLRSLPAIEHDDGRKVRYQKLREAGR